MNSCLEGSLTRTDVLEIIFPATALNVDRQDRAGSENVSLALILTTNVHSLKHAFGNRTPPTEQHLGQ